MNERLFFESLKEHRGSYFAEYQPPVADNRFATVDLVFLNAPPSDVATCMEVELQHWISRYPVPLMVWAWDSKEEMIKLPNCHDCLVGWVDPICGQVNRSWEIGDLTNFLKSSPAPADWRKIYAGISFKTDKQVRIDSMLAASQQRERIRILRVIMLLWLAAIPAAWAVIEFWGPEWLGLIIFLYSLGKACRAGMEIWGLIKPWRRDEVVSEKQRKMEHYYYHCERNPEGFARLRSQNFEQDSRDRTRKEAAELGNEPSP